MNEQPLIAPRAHKTIFSRLKPKEKTLKSSKFVQKIRMLLKEKSLSSKNKIIKKTYHEECPFIKTLRRIIINDLTLDRAIEYWKTDISTRGQQQIKAVAEFLSLKFPLFARLQKADWFKYYNLINQLSIKTYRPNDIIGNYDPDKPQAGYIILEGTAGKFLSQINTKQMCVKDFIFYLNTLYKEHPDHDQLYRIEKENPEGINITLLHKRYNSYEKLETIKQFAIEEQIQLSEYGPGIVLWDKIYSCSKPKSKYKEKIETIKAVSNLSLAYINRFELNMFIKEIEAADIISTLRSFKKDYRLLQDWTTKGLHRWCKKLETVRLINGDSLYKQGDSSEEGIFFTINGTFEATWNINISSVKDYIHYLNSHNQNENIITILKQNTYADFPSDSDIHKTIETKMQMLEEFPIKIPKSDFWDNYYKDTNDLIKIKLQEDKIMNIKQNHLVVLRKYKGKEILGWEDWFMLKKRFYNITCTSINAELKRISMKDLMIILIKNQNIGMNEIFADVIENKNYTKDQVWRWLNLQLKKNKMLIQDKYEQAIHRKEPKNNDENKKSNDKQLKNTKILRLKTIDKHQTNCNNWIQLKSQGEIYLSDKNTYMNTVSSKAWTDIKQSMTITKHQQWYLNKSNKKKISQLFSGRILRKKAQKNQDKKKWISDSSYNSNYSTIWDFTNASPSTNIWNLFPSPQGKKKNNYRIIKQSDLEREVLQISGLFKSNRKRTNILSNNSWSISSNEYRNMSKLDSQCFSIYDSHILDKTIKYITTEGNEKHKKMLSFSKQIRPNTSQIQFNRFYNNKKMELCAEAKERIKNKSKLHYK